jgi:hypothetical protein
MLLIGVGPVLFSIRFRGIPVFLIRRVINDVRRIMMIPSIGFIMFIDFDFEVDLHKVIITVY